MCREPVDTRKSTDTLSYLLNRCLRRNRLRATCSCSSAVTSRRCSASIGTVPASRSGTTSWNHTATPFLESEGVGCCARWRRCRAISESIPSAAVLHRRVGIRDFIEERIIVIGVSFDKAVFDPSGECCFVDAESSCSLEFCEHAAVAQSVAAGWKPVSLCDV